VKSVAFVFIVFAPIESCFGEPTTGKALILKEGSFR
jgi:hypothetical protein